MTDTDDAPLVPVRMLNEFTYCPRLGVLEWVEGEFRENADTAEGTVRHRAVDRPGYRIRRIARSDESADGAPAPEVAAPARVHARSVEVSDPGLGLIAKIDLLEAEGRRVRPVDYKKGPRPHTAHGAWDPERVQLCAQGLLLRANGFECDEGVLYFRGSNERVSVVFDDELIALTRTRLDSLRDAAASGALPPPLDDSPKCPRCSLVTICLPDETRFLLRHGGAEPRRLIPADDDARPMYVQQAGATVRKNGEVLEVHADDERIGEMRIRDVSQLVVFGRVQVTTPVVHVLCEAEAPIVYCSSGGWLMGITTGLPHKNILLRQHQYRHAADATRCAAVAGRLVRGKLMNMRTVLRRNHPDGLSERALDAIKREADAALRAPALETVIGHEGAGSRVYFEHFGALLRAETGISTFDFNGRNRRPPRDRVNALLSFAYALLTREWTTILWTIGLDPYLGFLHRPRYGRPALALDLMEAFRPLIADSVVITVVNNGEVTESDFVERFGAVNLTPAGRRKLISAFERRIRSEITHPTFGYRVSYRRAFEVEARLFARSLTGELPSYDPMTTR